MLQCINACIYERVSGGVIIVCMCACLNMCGYCVFVYVCVYTHTRRY
jgi:hypothetical protein